MADDDAVIRRRLLTRTSTVGQSGFKKCTETILTLVEFLLDESVDTETCKQELDALFWEMAQLEFEANKTEIWNYTCDRELEEYETLNLEIDTSISKVTKDIEELKQSVFVEKRVRLYKEEYESIARVINELPSRREVTAEIEHEQKRLKKATTAMEAVEKQLDLRTKQFALLMNTIQNLQATLSEDMAEDEKDNDDDDGEQQEDEEMEEEDESKDAAVVLKNDDDRSPSSL